MSANHFTIAWDADRQIIALDLSGFWSESIVACFSAETSHTIRLANGAPFDLIVNVTGTGPQSQMVVKLVGDAIAQFVSAGLSRLVVIGAGALVKMQVKRAAAPLESYFAESAAEAQRWLGVASCSK